MDTVILDSYFGHSYSGQLFWTRLFWTVDLDTVILDSCYGHSYSGQLFWTRLFWSVDLDTVILGSYFAHSNSGVILDSHFGHRYFRAARMNFRALIIDLSLGKLNQHRHPIKSIYRPKIMTNRSPTHPHTLQYPLSTALLAKGSNVPSLMEMVQVTSKTLNKVRPALEYRLQMCSFTNDTPPPILSFPFPIFRPCIYLSTDHYAIKECNEACISFQNVSNVSIN